MADLMEPEGRVNPFPQLVHVDGGTAYPLTMPVLHSEESSAEGGGVPLRPAAAVAEGAVPQAKGVAGVRGQAGPMVVMGGEGGGGSAGVEEKGDGGCRLRSSRWRRGLFVTDRRTEGLRGVASESGGCGCR